MDFLNSVDIHQLKKDKQLFEAAKENNTELMLELLNSEATPCFIGEDNNSALHWSAYHGNHNMVELLLNKKANIYLKGADGYTAIHYAAQEGHDTTVKLLCINGANVLAIDDDMDTPLHIASKFGRDTVVNFLLSLPPYNNQDKNNNNINLKESEGYTALHAASINGYEFIVRLLCLRGSDLNLKGSDGYTALHFAAKNEHIFVVKQLIQQKADVFVEDDNGKSPLRIALELDKMNSVYCFLSLLSQGNIEKLIPEQSLRDNAIQQFKKEKFNCQAKLRNIVVLSKTRRKNTLLFQPVGLLAEQLSFLDEIFPAWYAQSHLLKDLNDFFQKYYNAEQEESMLCEFEPLHDNKVEEQDLMICEEPELQYDSADEIMGEVQGCGNIFSNALVANTANHIYSYVPSLSNASKRKRGEANDDNLNANKKRRKYG